MARGLGDWQSGTLNLDYCPRGGPRCCAVVAPPAAERTVMYPLPAVGEHDSITTDNEESNSSSSWDIDTDIRRHIQHCTCTCNHMGYGNFMDYSQQASDLPDVAPSHLGPPILSIPTVGGPSCNGRAIPVRDLMLPPSRAASFGMGSMGQLNVRESFSSESSKTDSKGWEVAARHWCLLLGAILLATALGAGLGVPLAFRATTPRSSEEQGMDIVRRILKETPLIDGHNDFPWNVRMFLHNRLNEFNFTDDLRNIAPWSRSNWSHTDLPRLRTGLLGAQFWSAYVPCGAQDLDAVQLVLEQVDAIKRLMDLHPAHLQLVTSSQGIEEAHRAGKIASLIGVEGGHAIGNSLAVLRMLHDLGAKYLTLTHACSTPWAGCSQSGDDPEQGLSNFGKAVVREMNRLGMLVDLSHASTSTMRDALAAARAPLIFSHSSARALCNSSRNVPDDVLKLVADNGGVVMVNFYPLFVTCNDSASITDVVEHINHIRSIAGEDHIGLGAGFDGINLTPRGLEDVGSYPRLFALLLEQGEWSEAQLHKLAGRNLLRVLKQVEQIQSEWRLAGVKPSEEYIPPEELEGHTDCMYLSPPSS